MTDTTPQLDDAAFRPIDRAKLLEPAPSSHPPRILLLYGSLRQRSFSRLLTEEAARILARYGVETRSFDPHGLPLVDESRPDHQKVQELMQLVTWCEGMVW